MKKQSLVIVGAGAAGLMAALELASDYSITILEAMPRTGGRIHTTSTSSGKWLIEAGPEFVHGHLPLTLQLLQAAGLQTLPVTGKNYRRNNGEWTEQIDMAEGWDELIQRMKKLKKDQSLNNFLEKFFHHNESVCKQARAFAEGFDLADPNMVSVQALLQEWVLEEENFRIPGGYSQLVEYMEKRCIELGCTILCNKPVQRIDWTENNVSVQTGDDTFQANKIIVAVPLPVLQNQLIQFSPSIDNYVTAANHIGKGHVLKITLLFDQLYWPPDACFIFSEEMIPTWWTSGATGPALLTGWLGGPKAAMLQGETTEAIIKKAVHSLSQLFGRTLTDVKESILEAHVFNWQQDEYIRYGYSYSTLDTAAARKTISTPISDTIFLAGEAVYDGSSPGTVEAALTSGKSTAALIKKAAVR